MPDPIPRKHGAELLREFMQKHGLSQRAMGKLIGADQPEVKSYVERRRRPSADRRFVIARVTKDFVPVLSWLPAKHLDAIREAERPPEPHVELDGDPGPADDVPAVAAGGEE